MAEAWREILQNFPNLLGISHSEMKPRAGSVRREMSEKRKRSKSSEMSEKRERSGWSGISE